MSQNQFVTSLNATTSAFITRQEVIQALSTIVPELSTLNISSLIFGSPNPNFSTIAMNPSGIISGFVPVQSSNIVLQPGNPGLFRPTNLKLVNIAGVTNSAVGATDALNNLAPVAGSALVARLGGAGSFGSGTAITSDRITFGDQTGGAGTVNFALYNQAGSGSVGLTNISTINGAPVGTQVTTYATLTGNNINNSQVIATPSIVSVSSINGSNITTFTNSQQVVPYVVTPTAASNVTMVANVPQTVYVFNNIPITAAVGKYVNMSVPMAVSPASGSVGAQTNVQMVGYLGGASNLNTGVSGFTALSPGSANSPRIVTLSGVAAVNGATAQLQIQAVCDQNVVLTFQPASFYNRFFFQQIV